MAPIDLVIGVLEQLEKAAIKSIPSLDDCRYDESEAKYYEGKAAGIREAINHLEGIKKIFN